MALKPTIYKFRISLSDLNRDYYDTLNLTLALHPSETLERMIARVLAYCLNVQEHLEFTRGLSEIDEPDIWVRTYDDQTALWIEVGEPSIERIKKAVRHAAEVKIYSFNSKSDVWWQQLKGKLNLLKAAVYQFKWDEIMAFAALVERTTDISLSISGDSAYIATIKGECEVGWIALKES